MRRVMAPGDFLIFDLSLGLNLDQGRGSWNLDGNLAAADGVPDRNLKTDKKTEANKYAQMANCLKEMNGAQTGLWARLNLD